MWYDMSMYKTGSATPSVYHQGQHCPVLKPEVDIASWAAILTEQSEKWIVVKLRVGLRSYIQSYCTMAMQAAKRANVSVIKLVNVI